VLPAKTGSCWFIPETDSRPLPVYEIKVNQLESLINDCYGFEYNLVAKDFSWLFMENDHDQYYICRHTDQLRSLVWSLVRRAL
jgi:hypothetical protein